MKFKGGVTFVTDIFPKIKNSEAYLKNEANTFQSEGVEVDVIADVSPSYCQEGLVDVYYFE